MILTMRELADQVAFANGISVAALRGQGRCRFLAWPRQEFMYRAHVESRKSLTQIGAFLGRDHTTVLHGVRRHKERMEAAAPKRPVLSRFVEDRVAA